VSEANESQTSYYVEQADIFQYQSYAGDEGGIEKHGRGGKDRKTQEIRE
jgi:hypothetical protein